MELVKQIIKKKKEGTACTEEDLAEVKRFVRDTIVMIGDGSVGIIEDIQLLFPDEFSEAIDEMEDGK